MDTTTSDEDLRAQVANLQSERDALAAEVERYRQAIWDARALMGFDNDGDPTPAAVTYPHLADMLLRDAAEFRKDYDEACSEAAEAEGLRADAGKWRKYGDLFLLIQKITSTVSPVLLNKIRLDEAAEAARTTGGEGHE